MRRQPIASSSLRSVGYDAETDTLEIEYVNGGLYRYLGVPPLVHRQLLKSENPGTFVNQRIKPFYVVKEIT
jgi:KTSC domain